MTDIYDLHKASFANVSAFVVMKGDDRVATIAIKFPRDGSGRLYAYLHVIGLQMVRGSATGYGYDKHSAALSSAARLVPEYTAADQEVWARQSAIRDAIVAALLPDNGMDWERRLRDAGFQVFQAV